MEIREVLEEKPWEEFLIKQSHTPFLQSRAWGEFQERLGFSHYRLGLFEGSSLVGICLAIVGRRRLGSFVYVPYGPVLRAVGKGQIKIFVEYLKDLANKEKVDYLRIEPPLGLGEETAGLLRESGFHQATAAIAQGGSGTSWLLDLALPEEELLMGMRKTTRYLVRKGEEAGIEAHRTQDPELMEEFHRLMGLTYQRQGFRPHSRHYLQTQFETLAPKRIAELTFARYKGDTLAAAINFSYGDTVSYVHGASVRSDVPASYFLQWENIKEAKKDGYRYFDFWGISPTDDPKHSWYGYSLFKKGFGGYRVDYLGVWDHPLTKRYWAVAGVEHVRKFIRR